MGGTPIANRESIDTYVVSNEYLERMEINASPEVKTFVLIVQPSRKVQ